jgi:hypothetical protein
MFHNANSRGSVLITLNDNKSSQLYAKLKEIEEGKQSKTPANLT